MDILWMPVDARLVGSDRVSFTINAAHAAPIVSHDGLLLTCHRKKRCVYRSNSGDSEAGQSILTS